MWQADATIHAQSILIPDEMWRFSPHQHTSTATSSGEESLSATRPLTPTAVLGEARSLALPECSTAAAGVRAHLLARAGVLPNHTSQSGDGLDILCETLVLAVDSAHVCLGWFCFFLPLRWGSCLGACGELLI